MSSDRQPSFTSSSSANRQNSGENEDVTWLDFLRTAGGTTPLERSPSADRKRRRHAGSSPERRAIPHHPAFTARRPSDRNYGVVAAGASREQAIDLTASNRDNPIDLTGSPQRPRMPQRMSSSNENIRGNARPPITRPTIGSMRGSFGGRMESSDIILPRWQPDADVSRCPVCQTQFGFWYRKHHCRKCGRVVCAACSPHRITIPRQYIVQPPSSFDSDPTPSSPTTGPYPRYLGGGDVVRVCNPCVPDPWTPDAAAEGASRGSGVEQGSRENANSLQRPERYRPVPPLPPFDHNRARSQSHQAAQPGSIFSRSVPQDQPPNFIFRESYNRPPPPPPPHQSRSAAIRNLQTSYPLPGSREPPMLPSTRPPIVPSPSAPPQPRQRREIREEDECPVCGNELPPGDSLREAHIQECITLRFSSTPSSSTPTAPARSSSVNAPTGPSAGIVSANPTSRSSTAQSANAVQQQANADTRPRATSFRPRGMAVYRATEKDCMTEDGDAQECVICFEEFQPGDEMGRMECLCKFHRVCIRSWWDTKGTGSCPTHMLHE